MAYKYPNRWLFSLSRLLKGYHPVFLEYFVDMSPRWTSGTGNAHIAAILQEAEPNFARALEEMAAMQPVVDALNANDVPGIAYTWRNGYLPPLDAVSVMWAASKAKRVFFEVGSGNSTMVARAALSVLGRTETKIMSVDPYPRREVDALCDDVIRKPLEQCDLSPILDLEAGDVLFIDSSHRSFMNSDVTVAMLEILPALKPGVLVGFHDICLPFDYPERWTKRAYNEQYLLGVLLTANPDYFDLQAANYWIAHRGLQQEPLAGIWDQLDYAPAERGGSAFWGVKR